MVYASLQPYRRTSVCTCNMKRRRPNPDRVQFLRPVKYVFAEERSKPSLPQERKPLASFPIARRSSVRRNPAVPATLECPLRNNTLHKTRNQKLRTRSIVSRFFLNCMSVKISCCAQQRVSCHGMPTHLF